MKKLFLLFITIIFISCSKHKDVQPSSSSPAKTVTSKSNSAFRLAALSPSLSPGDTIDIDIFWGQSNCVGVGLNTSLPSYLSSGDITGSWIYDFKDHKIAPLNKDTNMSTTGHHGLELSYMYRWNQLTGKTRCLAKYGVGNTYLMYRTDLKDWNAASVNEMLKTLITYCKATRDSITHRGYVPRFANMLIYIGETDAGDSLGATAFYTNMQAAIARVKSDVPISAINVVIIKTHDSGEPYVSYVRAAEDSIGRMNKLFDTDIYGTATHLTSSQYVDAGIKIADLLQ